MTTFFLFEKKILSHRDKELTDELKSVSDIQQTIIHHIYIYTFLYISPDHESKSVNEETLTFLSVDEKKLIVTIKIIFVLNEKSVKNSKWDNVFATVWRRKKMKKIYSTIDNVSIK